jgi:dynein heavy chain
VASTIKTQASIIVVHRRPFNPAAAGGAVERWLIDCEAAMRDTVRSVLKASFDAYSSTPRDSWMSAWPGQVVLAVDCMYWTAGTAAAIVRGTLQAYANQLTQELMQVCCLSLHAWL